MFCPKCKAEYVQGIERCSDCDVPLVDQMPVTQAVPEVKLVELLRTPNIIELTVVKSLLDSMGISYVVQGEDPATTRMEPPMNTDEHRSACPQPKNLTTKTRRITKSFQSNDK